MRINFMQFCILVLLLGLVGTSAGLGTYRLDYFYSEKERSHLAMDETSGTVYLVLCFPFNKSSTKPQLLLCGYLPYFMFTMLTFPIIISYF